MSTLSPRPTKHLNPDGESWSLIPGFRRVVRCPECSYIQGVETATEDHYVLPGRGKDGTNLTVNANQWVVCYRDRCRFRFWTGQAPCTEGVAESELPSLTPATPPTASHSESPPAPRLPRRNRPSQ